MPETPKQIPAGVLPSTCFSLLSSESLIEAASKIAADEGYHVVVDNACDDWDYREAARIPGGSHPQGAAHRPRRLPALRR